jgi:pimeloyl-ACP methyl ester carboxylesterase
MRSPEGYGLPVGVRSRLVPGVNGLDMHLLEAGFEPAGASPQRPCVLLLHGFPELAYSWRKVLPALAQAGYHAVAPDQRGFGRSTGWDADFDGELAPFGMLNLVRDMLALLGALGRREVATVVGHDFGSPVAAWCALARPDVFRSVVLMSAPFAGAPEFRFHSAGAEPMAEPAGASMAQAVAGLPLLPEPRKHYQWHYSTRHANQEMQHSAQGLHAFLRAYYHVKSADWPGNQPHPLTGTTAAELAKLPRYYVMDQHKGMAQTVAPEMPSAHQIADCRWLTEDELAVYSAEFQRTGFQGGLNWYRCATEPRIASELRLFAGRRIAVPSIFIAGKSDWGVYQLPGAFEKMQSGACSRMAGCHLIDGAGHWVQQEQAGEVNRLLLEFLRGLSLTATGPA